MKVSAVHRFKTYYVSEDGRDCVEEQREVVLICVSGKYAMVRRPGCLPYVAHLAELEVKPKKASVKK